MVLISSLQHVSWLLSGTWKLHRVMAASMALATTSAVKLDSQKAKEWGGVEPASKATAIILVT